MRCKPAAKPAEIDCALCDFKSVSKVKIIKHMKTSHTVANKPSLAPKVLAEDMSICEISDDEDVTDRGEKLLTESKSCVTCEFEAKEEAVLDEHLKECHSQPSVNLDEVAEKSPPTVKPIHLYKCNDCSFTTVTTDELQEHKKNKHKREKPVVSETAFLHSCISCNFRTNEYNSLRLHIDWPHRPTNQTAPVNIEENPRNSQFVNTDCVTCPFCNLKSKNLDELKTHFDNVHSDNKSKKNNKQDEIKSVSSDVCSNCTKCKFSGNKSELDKHLASKHGRKHICEECGINFIDVKTLKLHVKTKHENPSAIEPFPCEVCGLVLANFNLLQQHVKEHTSVKFNCQYCDFTTGDQESLQRHMVESHEEIAILCNMAKQVDKLSDGFASLENFKSEISNVLKDLFDNQHILEQELFLIRNNQASNQPKPAATSPSSTGENAQPQLVSSSLPAPPAGPPAQGPPVPPPRRTPPAPTGVSRAPPPVRHIPAPKVAKRVHTEPPKMLYIGDSISANVDIGAL